MELKKKEALLLRYFRKNARQALTKISRKTGMPVSTIFDKLKKYESSIITRHASLINFDELGYTTRAAIFLKTIPENRARLRSTLRIHENVNIIFRVNNGYDFFVEALFRTVQELEAFLEELELKHGVTQKNVFFVIEEVARESFMAELPP